MRTPVLAYALAIGCAGAPNGDSEQSLFGDTREGEAVGVAEVRLELGLVDNAALNAQLARIGASVVGPAAARLAAPSFRIVDQSTPNVFSVPPGHVFVTRGLLAALADEAELANLLAHELAHIEVGDATVASGPPSLAVGSTVMRAAMAGRGPARFALGGALVGRFSTRTEPGADALGQQNAAAAGFDAAAFVTALRTLASMRDARSQPESLPGFWVRHPAFERRLPDAAARAAAIAKSHAVGGRPATPLDWLDGMLVGPNPAHGVFLGDRFLHHDYGYVLRLPRGWPRLHSRTAVGAVAPDGRAQVSLERQGPAMRPEDAATQFLGGLSERMQLRVESRERLRSGGVPAYRAIAAAATPGGRVRLELTWFVLPTGVFRLVAASPPANAEKLEVAMRNVARSFQPLSDRERTQISEARLRFVTSAAGETLAGLATRNGNVWPTALLAAINGVDPNAPLAAGRRVRIAQRAPFSGRDLGANRLRP